MLILGTIMSLMASGLNVFYSKRRVNAGGNVVAFHQQVLLAMHILSGNQRRSVSLQ